MTNEKYAQPKAITLHICDHCGKRFTGQPSHYKHIRKCHPKIGLMNAFDESQGFKIPSPTGKTA